MIHYLIEFVLLVLIAILTIAGLRLAEAVDRLARLFKAHLQGGNQDAGR